MTLSKGSATDSSLYNYHVLFLVQAVVYNIAQGYNSLEDFKQPTWSPDVIRRTNSRCRIRNKNKQQLHKC